MRGPLRWFLERAAAKGWDAPPTYQRQHGGGFSIFRRTEPRTTRAPQDRRFGGWNYDDYTSKQPPVAGAQRPLPERDLGMFGRQPSLDPNWRGSDAWPGWRGRREEIAGPDDVPRQARYATRPEPPAPPEPWPYEPPPPGGGPDPRGDPPPGYRSW